MIYTAIQKYFREIYLLLAALFGLTLGSLAAVILGDMIAPAADTVLSGTPPAPTRPATPELSDYDSILQRNLFQAAVGAPPTEQTVATTAAPHTAARQADLTLVGVVVAGNSSLAVIRSGKTEEIYRHGGRVPGNGTLAKVERQQVTISYPDGTEAVLPLYTEDVQAAVDDRSKAVDENVAIREVGDNRWAIPREAANRARGNLNELLKQARMEPVIVDGRTDGFVVKMIRPRSFLAMLGIQEGDLLKSVNGMSLDSPEKALQIFQQLREADNISIDLIRSGSPQTFVYAID